MDIQIKRICAPRKDGLPAQGGRNSLAKKIQSHCEASSYVKITIWPLLSFFLGNSYGDLLSKGSHEQSRERVLGFLSET